MTCVNGGYLVSEIFNTIDRKTWREIKQTLQWPPMENQLVVYTQLWVRRVAVRAIPAANPARQLEELWSPRLTDVGTLRVINSSFVKRSLSIA